MFARIRQWFRDQRAWSAAHRAAWDPTAKKGEDGLSAFQRQCSEALRIAVPALMFEKHQGTSELYLVADLPNTKAKVYVYLDGSNIHETGNDFIAEEWDFKTPEELIQAVVEEARKRVAI